ncbi:MAG: hypothetical protein SH857_09040 [Chitinophagales bacterium]|nr:hypothetical protein [Chitinophagales bacterium]
MKSCLAALFIVVITKTISAQEVRLKELIPAGFSILDTVTGDLNHDGYPDYLLVLKNDAEQLAPDTARPLLILHGQQDGSCKAVARNDSIVLCFGCGGVMGDPYTGITVQNNSFTIAHSGGSAWRWSRVITFKYDKKLRNYILHEDTGESFHATEPDKAESHTYRKEMWGKVEFEEYKAEW